MTPRLIADIPHDERDAGIEIELLDDDVGGIGASTSAHG
jgi:hypothetical protein